MFTRFASKALFALAAVAAATVTLSPAHAAPRSAAVSYADLDLSTGSGQAQLKKRIAYAAATVCGPADTLSYHSKKSVAACRERAVTDAGRARVEVFAQAGRATRMAAN